MAPARTADHRQTGPGRGRVERLLEACSGPTPARDVAVVVAHPDDETIGCGARLACWRGATVVLVTDGAPRNLEDARAHGYADAAAYAGARRAEIEAALALAGLPPSALLSLDLPDQEAAHHLVSASRRLAAILAARRIGVVVTHAYEGGHPDHDAAAFAARAARALLARTGRRLALLEMPFYRADGDTASLQKFAAEPRLPEAVVPLTPPERELKRRMVAAHATQAAVLAPFDIACERFRLAAPCDVSALPNGGLLLYERMPWGLTGRRWQRLASRAVRELGLDAVL